jgi:hypothetical protein
VPSSGTPRSPDPVLGPSIGHVLINPVDLPNPRCGGVLPAAVTVSAEVTGGQPAQFKVYAGYTLVGGTGYAGEVEMRLDTTARVYRAALPRLEARHFQGTPRNLSISILVRGGQSPLSTMPGYAAVSVHQCVGTV